MPQKPKPSQRILVKSVRPLLGRNYIEVYGSVEDLQKIVEAGVSEFGSYKFYQPEEDELSMFPPHIHITPDIRYNTDELVAYFEHYFDEEKK